MRVEIRRCSWSRLSKSTHARLLKMTLSSGKMKEFAVKNKPRVFISYLEGKRCGWATLDVNCGVAMIYVAPGSRGRNVGGTLMEDMIEYSEDRGLPPPFVHAWNPASRRLFSPYVKRGSLKTTTFKRLETLISRRKGEKK